MKLSYNDQNHAYWLDGRRCKSITTVAKIPDDTYSLDQWRKRQVVVGMALDPSLLERASAHFDDRSQLDQIAEDALRVAKSHDAAHRGTAAHRIAERVDLGEHIIDTPLSRAVQAAWSKALSGAGLEIVPEYVERIVVYPQRAIAGRFDRIARRVRDKKLVIVDLKTGESAIKYPHSTAVQLALYANAPTLAGPIAGGGGSTETFEPMPEVDRRWAYVVHMPSDEAVEVHKVDIAAGWDIAQKAVFPILSWRSNRKLVTPVGATPVADPTESTSGMRSEWIAGRLRNLATDRRGRELAAARWPAGVPTRPPWTDVDVDLIDVALTSVETDVSAQFTDWDPALAGMPNA